MRSFPEFQLISFLKRPSPPSADAGLKVGGGALHDFWNRDSSLDAEISAGPLSRRTALKRLSGANGERGPDRNRLVVERRITIGAGHCNHNVASEFKGPAEQGHFEHGSILRVIDQPIPEPKGDRVGRPRGGDAEMAVVKSAGILNSGLKSGRNDSQHEDDPGLGSSDDDKDGDWN